MTTSRAGAATERPDPVALFDYTEAPGSAEPWMESIEPRPGLWSIPQVMQRVAQHSSIIWKH
jgi:hypothetical protein